MQRALDLDPDLDEARTELGMLITAPPENPASSSAPAR